MFDIYEFEMLFIWRKKNAERKNAKMTFLLKSASISLIQ
jgi:hypothetical protein